MKLVGYIRVSTPGQVDEGNGLQIQEKAIRTWCKEHRHKLSAVYRDEGVTGTTDEREGLTEALTAIRFNGAEGLVVHSLDRLARSLTVQEAALQQVWAAGGTVFAIDTGEVVQDDPDDPMRTFVRQVLGAVAQLEAGMIARRLRRGRRFKADQGGYAYGAPPYGWRSQAGDLVVVPEEMVVVERIRRYRGEGWSHRRIADQLNAEGVPSKRGGRWHAQTVARVADRVS